jgi:hypothetical protein
MSRFRNRVSGEVLADLPPTLAYGQWEVMCAEGLQINGCPVQTGDVVCGDRQGRWRVEHAAGERWEGTLEQAAVPGTKVLENLRTADLAAAEGQERPLDHWLASPPLAVELLREHGLARRERQLLHDRGALEHVCRQPRTYLRREVERTLTGRARRLAPKAEQFLAAHPEDWERRRLGAVLPRRVLASFIEEDWNTYENRVAARLVDRLRSVLQKRVLDLTTALDMLRELAQIAEFDDGVSHRKWERVCRLLGNAGDPRNGVLSVEQARDTLAVLLGRVRGLEDSPLYKRVPRRVGPGGALRQTNVLTSDQYYSRVARLWRMFSGEEEEQIPSDRDVYLQHQRIVREYEQFVALVLVWALYDLGFAPVEARVPTRDGSLDFVSADGRTISLRWDSAGFVIQDATRRSIRLLPIPHALTAPGGEGTGPLVVQALLDSAESRFADCPVIVLYPGTISERRKITVTFPTQFHQVTERTPSAEDARIRFIGVSPLEVDSVERVARVVRWWIMDSDFLAYPPVVACTADPKPLLEQWPNLLQMDGGRAVRLRRLPTPAERDGITSTAGKSSAVHRGRQRSVAGAGVPLIDRSSLEDAVALLERLRHCPVCDRFADATRDMQTGAEGFFRGTCHDCGTVWGAQPCGSCRSRYSMIIPGGRAEPQAPLGPEWPDLQYGRDLLATPCWASSKDSVAFICPNCTKCPNSGRAGYGRCERCIE